MSDYLDTEIFLQNVIENYASGDEIQGYLELFPMIDLGLHHLGYQVVEYINGRVEKQRKVIYSEQLMINDALIEAQRNEQSFQYNLPVELFSYRGKNANIYYLIESFVDFDDDTDQVIKKDAFKRLKISTAINPEKGTTSVLPLNIRPHSAQYYVAKDANYYKHKVLPNWKSVVMILAGGLLAGLISMSLTIGILFATALALIGSILLEHKIRKDFNPKVFKIYSDQETDFLIDFQLPDSSKARHAEVNYKIIEQSKIINFKNDVEISTKTVYKSPQFPLYVDDDLNTYRIDAPTDSQPSSIKKTDLVIYYKATLKSKATFFTNKYTKHFSVSLRK